MAWIFVTIHIIYIMLTLNIQQIFSFPIEKLHQYSTFNITKRPLNLYITANGKHAVVNNRTVDLPTLSSDGNGNTNVDYRISEPPFAIKRRGSAILLHNVTGNSLSWHQGRPSLVQMIAASGHTTVAIELKNKLLDSVKLIRQIVSAENLRNITFIVADENGKKIVEQLLDLSNKVGGSHSQSILPLVDGIVLMASEENGNGVLQQGTWQNALSKIKSSNEVVPIFVVLSHKKETKVAESNAKIEDSAIKIANLDAPQPNVDDGQYRLMKLLANFFDFIHPR